LIGNNLSSTPITQTYTIQFIQNILLLILFHPITNVKQAQFIYRINF